VRQPGAGVEIAEQGVETRLPRVGGDGRHHHPPGVVEEATAGQHPGLHHRPRAGRHLRPQRLLDLLEIAPELSLDVSILTRAVAEEPATLSLAPLGAITPEDIGRTVFISGTIESIDRFENGVRFRLEDNTGSIRLVLFSNVYDQLENGDALREGVSVSALGRVSEFNGALEVVPPNGASVRCNSHPTCPFLPKSRIFSFATPA